MKQPRPYPVYAVTPKAERSLTAGHPWVYGEEIIREPETAPENGALVDVVSRRGSYLGTGLLSLHSKIRIRLLSRSANDRFDEAFWRRRLEYAWAYRKTVMGPEDLDCCRIVFGEADQLPGLTVDRFHDILVTQTMSKSRSLAGGRLGFALGCPDLIADLNRVKYSFNPYNVNRLSILAGTAAMEDGDYFARCCAAIEENRDWTVRALEKRGFTILPSLANFLFAKSDRIGGEELYRRLKAAGVLVRWFDSDRIRDYVRITIGSRQQMEVLVERIDRLLAE